jgi:hypothetical protein
VKFFPQKGQKAKKKSVSAVDLQRASAATDAELDCWRCCRNGYGESAGIIPQYLRFKASMGQPGAVVRPAPVLRGEAVARGSISGERW